MGYISMNAPADSFSFTFENTTNDKRAIELFQLGFANAFTPTTKFIYEENTQKNPTFTAEWLSFAHFFKENPSNPFPNGTENTDCLWKTQTQITRLAVQDTAGNINFVDFPIAYSGNINDFNANLQGIIDVFVSAGQLEPISVRVTFNGAYGVNTTAGGNEWKGDCYGLTIEKEITQSRTGLIPSTKLQEIWLEQAGVRVVQFIRLNNQFRNNAQEKEIANGVIVSAGSGIPYKEIERSQNGAFLDIRGISVQVLPSSTSTQYTQNSQNLNSLGFLKINPNGDDYITYLNPTISPYQTQNVVNDIDMDDTDGLFVLDGNTRFEYDINPWTKVELTFDYVQFPNFLLKYGYKVAEAIIDVRQAEQDLVNISNNVRKNVELDIKESDYKKVVKMLEYAKGER